MRPVTINSVSLRNYSIIFQYIAWSENIWSFQEEDEEAYKRQFSLYIKKGVTADGVSKFWASYVLKYYTMAQSVVI